MVRETGQLMANGEQQGNGKNNNDDDDDDGTTQRQQTQKDWIGLRNVDNKVGWLSGPKSVKRK